MRLTKKKVIVTAAGAGIGRASAIAMADQGAEVYATDVDPNAVRDLEESRPDMQCAVLDVTDAQAIAGFATTVPTPDVLFNCAGYVHDGTLLE
ncbi:MAG: SDR family NAD(P)-dependent oxidoreductase, partial [Pseudomonadota bacterium]